MNTDIPKDTIIHEIPEWNIARLKKEINKLNKRAEKIGAEPIDLVDWGVKLVVHPEHRKEVNKGKLSFEDAPKVRVHLIALEGEPPKMDGYRFLGTLDHITLPGKVVVKTVPGYSIPSKFYNAHAMCDQCNKIRRRNETFVLHHEDDDKYTQVGRNCLKDFFGHDPNQIANFLSALWRLVDSFEDEDSWYEGGGSGVRDYYFPHQRVLEVTTAMIRTFGWVPRSSADLEDGRPATADLVLKVMLPAFGKGEAEIQKNLINDMKWDKEKDATEAKLATEWLSCQDTDRNEYLHNLQAVSEADDVPSRMFGYWCSLVAAYQRHVDRLNLNKASQKLNEWAGKEKERREFKIKVVSLRYFPGNYGTVTLHKMLDEDGRTLIWFANTDSKMEEQNTYTIKGTIKKHDEYKDWKQTVLSRVAVIDGVKDD